MPQAYTQDPESIAIIGMAGRFPGAANIAALWRNLCAGRECISFFSEAEVLAEGVDPELARSARYVKAGGVLNDADLFDAAFFGYSPREAETMDPQHRLFLECAWEALEDAGCDPERYGGLVGVFAGSALSTYLLRNLPPGGAIDFPTLIANDKDFVPARVAYKLNLKGPALNVQTACSTSLVAVHLACQSLLTCGCDMALAGGVSVRFPQKAGYVHEEESVLSPDGHCRAFDARARGTVGGSGVGIVVLKRLAEALADGDPIRAVIRGSAINNDGNAKVGFTAPGIEGQAEVIAAAQAMSGLEPEDVTYVETHGTGTLLGDPIEIAALTQAFRQRTGKSGFCAVGSVKTNVGHLDAAAGVTGLIKTVLMLEHRMLPPSLHFEQPNPAIDFAGSPFYVNTLLREWDTSGRPRVAGVSSFGLGGTNAHVVVEEAPAVDRSASSRGWQLLPLSARGAEALEKAAANLASHLREHSEQDLAEVAYTLQTGRRAFGCRQAVVADTRKNAVTALEALRPECVAGGAEPAVAFLFPGGGAQYSNMARGLYETVPHFRDQVDRCCRLLEPHLGVDLRRIIYPAPGHEQYAAEQLRRTRLGLPALFVIEYAVAQLWMAWGVRPAAMIGHSLGEYAAACIAGVFSLDDALAIVALRGRLMQTLPDGAMLAIPLPEAEVEKLLGGTVSIAAVNGPALCVASGAHLDIDGAAALLAAGGIEHRKVHVDVAAHSGIVDPILAPYHDALSRIRLNPPALPFISNLTGTWITAEQATDPAYWTRHMRRTVRFSEGLAELLRIPRRILVEAGPGHTLSTLARQHPAKSPEQLVLQSIRHPNDVQPDEAFLLGTAGRMWTAGVRLDWEQFDEGRKGRRVPLPTYPFERQRYWLGSARPRARSLTKNAEVGEWFYMPSWRRSLPPPPWHPGRLAGRRTWLVFDDRSWFTALLAKRLDEGNQDIILVRAGDRFEPLHNNICQIRPDRLEDYETIVGALRGVGRNPERVLHLWALPPGGDGYLSLLFLARALASDARELRVFVATTELFDATGTDRVDPGKSTLLGPAMVMSQEFPHVRCRIIDLDTTAKPEAADRVAAEIARESTDFAVALRGRERLVRAYEKVRLEPEGESVRPLRDRGVYLITGGLGRVGMLLAEYLARTCRARLALLGRSAGAVRGGIEALEALGAEVMVISADVASEDQMRAALDAIRARFGELHGVLHAAGITSGSSVFHPMTEIGQTESQVQFRPKIAGTRVLAKLLEGRALDFCLLFSSNAAVLGGLGFAAYAAANCFLDSFAVCQWRAGLPWVSATWDGWLLNGGAAAEPMRTSMDGYSMLPAESAEAFRRVATLATTGHVVVSTGDLDARLDVWVNREPAKQTPPAAHPRPKMRAGYLAPRNDVEMSLAGIWRSYLGIDPGVLDNFFELGGHSLVGTQIMSRVRQEFEVDLPLRTLFETRTIAALAEAVSARRAEMVLESVEQLADDEIASELARGIDA